MTQNNETAILAAGCFWGVEQLLGQTKGVQETQVGYIGGHIDHPTYKQICAGDTGHAEAVKVTFDPNTISYYELLEVFWRLHDPTSVNAQGPDVGHQYRSAIFTMNEQQKREAEKSKREWDEKKVFKKPIATEITPASTFYRAEEYHQKYFEKNGGGACHFIDE